MAMRAPLLIAVAVAGLLTSCEDDSAYRLKKQPYNTTGGPSDGGGLDGMVMSMDGAASDAGTNGDAGGVIGRGGSGGGGMAGMAGRGGAGGASGAGGAGGSGGTADAGLPDMGAPPDDAATD
jgi:hypothetical protein